LLHWDAHLDRLRQIGIGKAHTGEAVRLPVAGDRVRV
jgi:hypothetical protein